MANEEHLAVLQRGIGVWNQWRQDHPEIKPDLSEALLRTTFPTWITNQGVEEPGLELVIGMDLNEADLSRTNLHRASMNKAFLSQANLQEANLSEADLRGAIINGANLLGADLAGANLSGANLSGANLLAADLSNADLSRANLVGANLELAATGYTLFCNVDLSQTIGLGRVNHQGPSTVGIDTIYLSRGQIPEVFLRGCGVSGSFITYMRSLVAANAIEYHSCFISYSSKDEEFARRLYADLQVNNVPCWFAPEDLPIGEKIRPGIDQAIRKHEKLLLILSESSVASDWVEQEVETAFERERQEKRLVLFPVRLDDAVMEVKDGWPAHLRRTRNIGNFSGWNEHAAYQKAFDHLLRDLKSATSST